MIGTAVKSALATTFAVCLSASAARGQAVTGTVVDEGARSVAGVLVTLHDSLRQPTVRVLTDRDGRFYARAAAGSYRLTFEHIGFTPVERSVQLTAGAPVQADVQLSTAPVMLQRIVAEGKGRCGTTRDPQTAQIWYLARTALASVSAETPRRYRIVRYIRNLDRQLRVRSVESLDTATTHSTRPFRTEPTASLTSEGFVQSRAGDVYYFGPSAELLLSDDFVNGHCFRVAREKRRKGFVGLNFSPGSSKLKHDIAGTMWIDDRTGELKEVEYFYTGLDSDIEKRLASGYVAYERLEDGVWIVRRWHIRMPQYTIENSAPAWPGRRDAPVVSVPVRRLTIVRVIEEGAEVIEIGK